MPISHKKRGPQQQPCKRQQHANSDHCLAAHPHPGRVTADLQLDQLHRQLPDPLLDHHSPLVAEPADAEEDLHERGRQLKALAEVFP